MWAFSFIMLAKSKHETPMRSWPYIHKAVIYFFIGLFIRGGKILCCKNIFKHSRKEGIPQLLLYFVSGKSGVVSLLRHFSPGKWNPTRKKGHGIRAKEIEAVARPEEKKAGCFFRPFTFSPSEEEAGLERRKREGKGKREEGRREGGGLEMLSSLSFSATEGGRERERERTVLTVRLTTSVIPSRQSGFSAGNRALYYCKGAYVTVRLIVTGD